MLKMFQSKNMEEVYAGQPPEQKSGAVMASEARIVTYTVTLYDDDMRKLREFTGCRNARHENFGVAFEDEMRLKRYFEAPYISFEEQP